MLDTPVFARTDELAGSGLLPQVHVSAPPEQARALLQEWGALLIESALPPPEHNAIKASLAPYWERTPNGEGRFLGQQTKRFSGLIAKAPSTAKMAAHPYVLSVVEPLLNGDHCDAIQLNLTQAIAIGPGQGYQPMHRDETMYPFAHGFELIVNSMWPIDDFTEENGATRIVLKSHRWDRGRRAQQHEAVSAVAKAGSVLLWLGSIYHGGGRNISSAPRRGVVFNYNLGWLAQAEKLLLSTPPSLARRLPERLQRLIGYQVHRPALGWIEERDPIEWLHGEFSDLAAAQDHFTPDMEALLVAHFQSER